MGDAQGAPAGDAEPDFDDLPETYLDDAAYAEFLARELDEEGRPRAAGPPVTAWLLWLIGLILLGAALFLV